MMEDKFYQYVVYNKPRDFPDHYIVRRWQVGGGEYGPEKELFTSDTELQPIREKLRRMGLYNIGRSKGDDPVIVEVWI